MVSIFLLKINSTFFFPLTCFQNKKAFSKLFRSNLSQFLSPKDILNTFFVSKEWKELFQHVISTKEEKKKIDFTFSHY